MSDIDKIKILAEQVMGWVYDKEFNEWIDKKTDLLLDVKLDPWNWNPLENIKDAWDLVEKLKNNGIKMAIATGKGRTGLNRVLEVSGLSDYFCDTVCASEANSKPDPQMIEMLINRAGIGRSDVVMIGEMRDPETIMAAMNLAETGHLVMSTLHTSDAVQTISRIVGAFPADQQSQVLSRLADTLIGVLSQRLVPRADHVRR